MDVNNDGKIDAADRAAKRSKCEAFASLDANGDGSISRAEWDNQMPIVLQNAPLAPQR